MDMQYWVDCMSQYINDTEYAVTGKGTYFRKDKKGFLPELMQSMYNDRVKFKNKMAAESPLFMCKFLGVRR